MPEKIELLKVRDFGEIITDTFIFARQNFKQLFKSFFVFSGFFLFVGALLLALQQARTVNGLNTINFGQSQNLYGQQGPFGFLTVDYFLGLFFMLFGYISLQITIFSFIALYKQKGNVAPTVEEVWGYFKYFFWRVIGSGLLLSIMLIIGFIFCFIPGIYLYPVFALIIPIIVFENASFTYSFNKSFRLISNNWWLVFGAIFVMGLIVGVASFIILVPVTAINMINVFTHFLRGSQMSMIMSVVTAICQLISHVLYVLPIITTSLCYFSLSEQLDGTGLIARISQIGIQNIEDNTPEEEH